MKLTTFILGCAIMVWGPTVLADVNGVGGKNYGSVRVQTASPVSGAPGNPVNVKLDYAGLPAAGATITYRTEGNLTLDGPATRQLMPDDKGMAHDTPVVHAASAGVYFLNVFAKAKGVTIAVSIPVTVGTAVLKPRTASAVATPGGRSVIEMPAQQTVQ